MKAHKFFVIGMGLLYLTTSCTKEENAQQTIGQEMNVNATQTELMTFHDNDDFLDQTSRQMAAFEAIDLELSRENQGKTRVYPELTFEMVENGTFDQKKLNEMSKSVVEEYVATEVKRHERFMQEFPKYRNFNSIYNLYIEILRTNDRTQWEAAVQQYPRLFMILNNTHFIALHTDVMNVNMNLKEQYKVGADLYEYHPSSIRVVRNHNLSTEEVEIVQTVEESSTRAANPNYYLYKEYYHYQGTLKVGGGMLRDYVLNSCVGSKPRKYFGKTIVGSWVNGAAYKSEMIKLEDTMKDENSTDSYTKVASESSVCNSTFTHGCHSTLFYRNLKVTYQYNENTQPFNYWVYTNGIN